MSIAFNNTTDLNGLVQQYELEIGVNQGDVSGDATELKKFTAQVNLVWDQYLTVAFRAAGTWQFDDSNHTKYPIITTNLVANQRDYSFTEDEDSNLILDIHKVLVAGSDGVYREITPRDVQTQQDTTGFTDGQDATGAPDSYDKTANGIFLNPVPDVSVTNGLKIYINREASYFADTDTTKKPGCPGNHHRLFFLQPALDHARRNDLSVYNKIENEVIKLIGDESRGIQGTIQKDFAQRAKDERKRLIPSNHSNK